jgi:F-type H+-transporting ATPase subunit c
MSIIHIAEMVGDIGRGLSAASGCFGAALGVSIIGTKAVDMVGRNPGASGKILVQSILGMALAEAIAFYALFLYN